MTTAAPTQQAPVKENTVLSDDYDERAAQVAALVAARKAKLALEKKKAEEKAEKSKLFALMFADGEEGGEISHEETQRKKDFKQIRVGGAKGKEGRADHTRGKSAFKRPCTVGWKSQNQPLMKGGGNRTPL
jgi:hypothetical protein